MLARAKLIVMVNHDLKILEKVCDTDVWMESGAVRLVGPIREMTAAYTRHVEAQKRDGITPPVGADPAHQAAAA